MFRNIFTFPTTDIINLQSKDDCKNCGIELNAVGRPVGAQPVDQFDSKPFMMAENGFRRSDISLLMNAESEDLKRSIAANIQEIKSNFPDQSIDDATLADMAIPRHCQVGSSLRDWIGSLDKSGIAKTVDAYLDSIKQKVEPDKQSVIEFNETESE